MSILSLIFGPNVKRLKESKDVEGLKVALKRARKADDRASAADALGDICGAEAATEITEALNDASTLVRNSAVESLRKIGPGALVAALHTWGGAKRWDIAELECITLATTIIKDGATAGDAQLASIIERMQAVTQAERAAIEALLPFADPTVTEALLEDLRKALQNYIRLEGISRAALSSTAPAGLMATFAAKWRQIDSANESMTDDVCQVLVTAILKRGDVAANSVRELLRGPAASQVSDWASAKANRLIESVSTNAV